MKTVFATLVLLFTFSQAQAQSLITCTEELSGDRGTKIVSVAINAESVLMMNEMRETDQGFLVSRGYPVTLEASEDKIRVLATEFRTVQNRRRLTIDKSSSIGILRNGNTIINDNMVCDF